MGLAQRQFAGDALKVSQGKVKLLDTKFLDWLRDVETCSAEASWRREAREDYQFYAGKQDTAEVVALLQEQRRPTSVHNEIKPKVDMLCGIVGQTKWDVDAIPVGVEDEPLAELITGTMQHFRRKLKIQKVESDCFMHMVQSGRSYQYFWVTNENPFNPTIRTKRLQGSDVFVDPDSVEYDLSDARYVFIQKWLTEDEVKRFWPNVPTDQIRGGSGAAVDGLSFFDEAQEKFRFIECWYKKYVKKVWFVNPLTGKEEALTRKEFAQFSRELEAGINVQGQTVQVPQPEGYETWVEEIHYVIFTDTIEIEGGPSPYKKLKRFPIVLYGAYLDVDENRWFGVVNQMKDPQRSVNTMRRQLLHLLQTLPKGLLVHESGSILNIEEYEERSSDPTFHLELRPGGIDKYKFEQQPQISPIYAQFDAICQQGMKDTSGIQNELMGVQTTSREPGVSVRARQETGIAVLFIIFENFRHSRLLGAEILLGLVQQYVSEPTVIRINGEQGRQLMEINSQVNPQVEGWNDITAAEFDLVLDETVHTATMRRAIAQILSDFGHNNPGAIPPDLVLEYSDIPYTAKTRVRQSYEQQLAASQEAAAVEQKAKEFEMQYKAKELTLKEREVVVKEEEVEIKKAEAGIKAADVEVKREVAKSRQTTGKGEKK